MAILVAMLTTAVAAYIVTTMMSAQYQNISRTESLLHHEQGWLYSRGIDAWAIGALNADLEKNSIDSGFDIWNYPIKQTAIKGGSLSASIIDLQAFFNLNNLVGARGPNGLEIMRFNRLLRNLELPLDVTDSIVDWIDGNSTVTYPNGAEDDYYTNKEQPYRTANNMIYHTSELMLIKGISYDVYEKLKPHIASLPVNIPINVNTASIEVLRTLADGITVEDAENIIATRSDKPFASVEEFIEHPALAGREISAEKLSVSTSYFHVSGIVSIGNHMLHYASVINRDSVKRSHVIQKTRERIFHD
ncbi:MAG: type II secretion system minor pseudopilin GspK [Chromatiales bacterium]